MSGLLLAGLLFVFFIKFIGGGLSNVGGLDVALGSLTSIIRMASIALMVAAGVLMFTSMPNTPSLAPPASEPVYTQAMVEQLLAQQAIYHKRHMLVDRAQQVAALNMAATSSAPMVLPAAIVDVEKLPVATPPLLASLINAVAAEPTTPTTTPTAVTPTAVTPTAVTPTATTPTAVAESPSVTEPVNSNTSVEANSAE
jgi:hypothetical protein